MAVALKTLKKKSAPKASGHPVAVAAPGHNQPPEPTPFESSKDEIETLFGEAKHWLDGAPVSSQAEADGISKLLDMLRKAVNVADDRRKIENKPHDEAKAEIQARYNSLIGDTKTLKGKATIAIDACKKALAPWLHKIDDENAAKAEAARIEADRKQAEAQAAVRAASGKSLEQQEQAEEIYQDAKAADAEARRAENAKAHASGGTRAIGLRTYYIGEITDRAALIDFFWNERQEELFSALAPIVKRLVDGGNHKIPGVTVKTEKRV